MTCRTEICNAVCCRCDPVHTGAKLPCEHLTEDNLCGIHSNKPEGCRTFPKGQFDIDEMNKRAERKGFSERCIYNLNCND